MNITIAAVGKIKEKYLKDGIEEYAKRLSRFCRLNIAEVPDEKAPEGISKADEEGIREKEALRLIKQLKPSGIVICLDVGGHEISSEGFAELLKGIMLKGRSDITFIIGGSLGLHNSLRDKADYIISLSQMTFPHQLTRLILVEQLFRAFKINNNETYHK